MKAPWNSTQRARNQTHLPRNRRRQQQGSADKPNSFHSTALEEFVWILGLFLTRLRSAQWGPSSQGPYNLNQPPASVCTCWFSKGANSGFLYLWDAGGLVLADRAPGSPQSLKCAPARKMMLCKRYYSICINRDVPALNPSLEESNYSKQLVSDNDCSSPRINFSPTSKTKPPEWNLLGKRGVLRTAWSHLHTNKLLHKQTEPLSGLRLNVYQKAYEENNPYRQIYKRTE